jgi:hypothetical protein
MISLLAMCKTAIIAVLPHPQRPSFDAISGFSLNLGYLAEQYRYFYRTDVF